MHLVGKIARLQPMSAQYKTAGIDEWNLRIAAEPSKRRPESPWVHVRNRASEVEGRGEMCQHFPTDSAIKFSTSWLRLRDAPPDARWCELVAPRCRIASVPSVQVRHEYSTVNWRSKQWKI